MENKIEDLARGQAVAGVPVDSSRGGDDVREPGDKTQFFDVAELTAVVYWPENADEPLSKKDFVDLAKGSLVVARNLFDSCEWQHPSTLIDEHGGLDFFNEVALALNKQAQKIKVYTSNEMQSAVEIASIAGSFGYHTVDSRDSKSQFIDWAVEFEKTPYDDGDWMELINSFTHEKCLGVMREGGARIDRDVSSRSYSDAVYAIESTGKVLEDLHADASFTRNQAKVVDVTGWHVAFSFGKTGLVLGIDEMNYTPKTGSVCRIDYKPGKLAKITPIEHAKDKSVER